MDGSGGSDVRSAAGGVGVRSASPPGLGGAAAFGIGAGLFVALLDLAWVAHALEVSFLQLLLLRKGNAELPVVFFDPAALVTIGVAVGSAAFVLLAALRPALAGERRAHWLAALTLGGIAALWIALRAAVALFSHSGSPRVGAIVLTAAGALLTAAAFAWPLARHPQAPRLYTPRATRALVATGAVALLASVALPSLLTQVQLGRRAPEPPTPHVLVIVLDTLRADALSVYGGAASATPHIDALASESLRFSRAYSPAPWTLPAHASLFTGLYPSQHGAGWAHQYLDDEYTTLAEAMSASGYRTLGLSENPFFSAAMGLSRGFQEFFPIYRDAEPLGYFLETRLRSRLSGGGWKRAFTLNTINRFEAWLLADRGDDRPFFAVLNFMAAHLPRYPNPDHELDAEDLAAIERVNLVPELHYLSQYRLHPRQLAVMRELYVDDIRRLDGEIGRLLDFLRDASLLDDTLVVLTSDHGEHFGEHGLIEHQFSVYNTLLHVPLLIRLPGAARRGLVTNPVSTAALAATIFEQTGCADCRLPDGAETRSLLAPEWQGFVLSEADNAMRILPPVIQRHTSGFDYAPFDRAFQTIQDRHHKLIRDSNGTLQLFRIAEDPNELHDLSRLDSEKARELVMLLDRMAPAERLPRPQEPPRVVDEETRRALRALGYGE